VAQRIVALNLNPVGSCWARALLTEVAVELRPEGTNARQDSIAYPLTPNCLRKVQLVLPTSSVCSSILVDSGQGEGDRSPLEPVARICLEESGPGTGW
jgi:hypothetical protein